MTPQKIFHASILGGLLLLSGSPQVYAHSIDYQDAVDDHADITLVRHPSRDMYKHAEQSDYRHSGWKNDKRWEPEKRESPKFDEQPKKLPMFTLDSDYEQVEYIKGSYASLMSFTILTGGMYELSLTDLSFPDPLKDLGAAVTTSDSKLGQLFGSGSMLFDAQPGTYYLSVFANTLKACDLGLFGLNLHAYSGTPSAVPVPGALWLFGSGLLGLAGIVRRMS